MARSRELTRLAVIPAVRDGAASEQEPLATRAGDHMIVGIAGREDGEARPATGR
jgi:hypothetical protein